MKKQLPTNAITNELAGASAFFQSQATPLRVADRDQRMLGVLLIQRHEFGQVHAPVLRRDRRHRGTTRQRIGVEVGVVVHEFETVRAAIGAVDRERPERAVIGEAWVFPDRRVHDRLEPRLGA